MRITQRAQRIEPFYVMEVAKAASAVAAQVAQSESPMIFLNIGKKINLSCNKAATFVNEVMARTLH